MADLRKPIKYHNAIVGAIAFAFIAAGVGAQFSDVGVLNSNVTIGIMAFCGGLLGKCIAI